MVVLRSANLGDAPEVLGILRQYPDELQPISLGDVRGWITKGTVLFQEGVVLVIDRTPRLTYYGVPMHPRATAIKYLAAGQAGGSRAGHVLEAFRSQVKCPLYLLVRSNNPRAIRFYQKHGFYFAKTVVFKNFTSDLMVRA